MQFIDDVKQKAGVLVQENASTLLTVGGVVGTVATAVLAAKAAFKAGQLANHDHVDEVEGVRYATSDDMTTMQKTVKIAPLFVPPVITGTATAASIIMAHRMSAQKIAALAAAYGLAERNFGEYKDKVAEKLTGPKKQQIEDELAQEAVDRTPGSDRVIIVEGEVLCFDKATGRYFNSTVEQIRQAVNTTNAEIFNHGFTTVNFFYEELGLPPTTWAGEVGFDGDNVLDIEFSTTMAPGNRPCVAIDFRSMPRTEVDGPKYG